MSFKLESGPQGELSHPTPPWHQQEETYICVSHRRKATDHSAAGKENFSLPSNSPANERLPRLVPLGHYKRLFLSVSTLACGSPKITRPLWQFFSVPEQTHFADKNNWLFYCFRLMNSSKVIEKSKNRSYFKWDYWLISPLIIHNILNIVSSKCLSNWILKKY